MRLLRRLLTETDLAAGLGAVLVLLVCAVWLTPPWAGLLPAVLVYLGLRLLLVQRAAARAAARRQAVRAAGAQIDEVGRLAGRIPKA